MDWQSQIHGVCLNRHAPGEEPFWGQDCFNRAWMSDTNAGAPLP